MKRFSASTPSFPRQSPERGGSALFYGIVTTIFLLSITLAVTIGPVWIHPRDVWEIIIFRLLGMTRKEWPQSLVNIVLYLRLPRVLLGAVTGAGLTMSGATMQAVLQNPMADPFVLGISAGASTGAVLVILFGGHVLVSSLTLPLAAFGGGFFACILALSIARIQGAPNPLRLILAGMAISYIFSSLTSFLVFQSPHSEGIRNVYFWLLGSLAGARWHTLFYPTLFLVVAAFLIMAKTQSLNVIALGEETALSLGVNPSRLRVTAIIASSLVTGSLVAYTGIIGFVGLMMPHIVRFMVGPDHRKVFPLCLLLGSMYLVWIDTFARIVVKPMELPLSIPTAIVGAPFLILLLNYRVLQEKR